MVHFSTFHNSEHHLSILAEYLFNLVLTVGAASQWWSNERMMVYFKLMMVKCFSMMVKWVNDHILNSPSLTSIIPSLTSILPSLAWSKPSFAHLQSLSSCINCFSAMTRYTRIATSETSSTTMAEHPGEVSSSFKDYKSKWSHE